MSEIEKAKATCAKLKGHCTRAKNMLAKELEAIKSPHVIENAFDEATMKLKKVDSHLEDMENLEGVDDEWLAGEFQAIEENHLTLIEMIKQGDGALADEVFQEDAGNVQTAGVSRIPKQNFKKPNELEEQAT